jgi:2'-5' RNA ligase
MPNRNGFGFRCHHQAGHCYHSGRLSAPAPHHPLPRHPPAQRPECHDGLLPLLSSPSQLVVAYVLQTLEMMGSPALAELSDEVLNRRQQGTIVSGSFKNSMDLGGLARQIRKRARSQYTQDGEGNRMAKLFVAIDLPPTAIAGLLAIRPPPGPGIRLADADQMHLTLHFIGEAGSEPIAAALGNVAASAFHLAIHGVGQFPTANGSVTLWAGVVATSELLALHAAVGKAIADADVGVRLESRPYAPHITLGRCEASAAPDVVDEFLSRNAAFALSGMETVEVTAFGLFSSAIADGLPVYRRERSFPLLAKRDKGTTPKTP